MFKLTPEWTNQALLQSYTDMKAADNVWGRCLIISGISPGIFNKLSRCVVIWYGLIDDNDFDRGFNLFYKKEGHYV